MDECENDKTYKEFVHDVFPPTWFLGFLPIE